MCVELKKELRTKGIEYNNDSLQRIQDRADDVLKFFGIKGVPDGGIPIVKILKQSGIKVYKDNRMEGNLSAFIAIDPMLKERFGSNKIVFVNSNDTFGHMRFALAHELAHYLFDFDETKKVKYYNTYIANEKSDDNMTEARANKFAACLLMPQKEFIKEEKRLSADGVRVDTVSALADKFGVSPKAVYRRFEELKIKGYE